MTYDPTRTYRCVNCGYYEDEDGAAGYCEGIGYGYGHHFTEVDADGMALGPEVVGPSPEMSCVPSRAFWQRLRGVRQVIGV